LRKHYITLSPWNRNFI